MEERHTNAQNHKGLNKKNNFSIDFLPSEPLIGVKIRNCEIRNDEETFKNCIGIHVGIFFTTFKYERVV
tara:strand:- start:4459 stop:4665 length:207 start_codon:yes stop_codon:yes gene_type:complete